MSVPTCTVRAIVNDSVGGQAIEGARVTATLSSYEVYQGYVVPQMVEALTNAAGEAFLDLWPNELGSVESFYTIKIIGNGKTLRTTAVIPNLPAVDLHTVANLPPYDGMPDGAFVLAEVIEALTQARAARDAANVSATSASASAAAAGNSVAASLGFATAASNSASTATTKAGEASTSADSALSYRNTANTAATNASASATSAGTSATNASNSATAAGTSATNASNSATAAANSATTANTKAGEASTSATNAAASANTTTTKAGEAAAFATTASTGATTATTKAGEAATSATNAANSATAAAASAAEAANKEPTITAGTIQQYWRGDKTWRDFFTDVRAATLTGLSLASSAAITATDTVLTALGRLQAQITLRAPLDSPALTGTPTAPTPASTENTTKLATTAWCKLGFVFSNGLPGYFKFPDWMGGFIIQWGPTTGTIQSAGEFTITYPIAFPNQYLHAVTSNGNINVGLEFASPVVPTATSLVVVFSNGTARATAGVSRTCNWIAIGR